MLVGVVDDASREHVEDAPFVDVLLGGVGVLQETAERVQAAVSRVDQAVVDFFAALDRHHQLFRNVHYDLDVRILLLLDVFGTRFDHTGVGHDECVFLAFSSLNYLFV